MSLQLSGLVVPYGQAARIGDASYATRFSPGAFSSSIRRRSVECWINHRRVSVVASQADGTLAFCEHPGGLFCGVTIHDARWADILAAADHLGVLHGVSVGTGRPRHVRWDAGVQVVDDVALDEISLCINSTWPAFRTTWARVADVARAAA
jgi:HK97 family phage prohead protease